jgi:hypothetical protein
VNRLDEFTTTTVRQRGRWIAQLVGDSNALYVGADVPLASYRLDASPPWLPEDKRCDALLVVEDPPLTVFVELKGAVDNEKNQKAEAQLLAAMEHFAPTKAGKSHGDQHHERWRNSDDLPAYTDRRKEQRLSLAAEHHVFGIVVGRGVGTRKFPPTELSVGERIVPVLRVSTHKASEDEPMELASLLAQFGLEDAAPESSNPRAVRTNAKSRRRKR